MLRKQLNPQDTVPDNLPQTPSSVPDSSWELLLYPVVPFSDHAQLGQGHHEVHPLTGQPLAMLCGVAPLPESSGKTRRYHPTMVATELQTAPST
jgi:hypothetical protein